MWDFKKKCVKLTQATDALAINNPVNFHDFYDSTVPKKEANIISTDTVSPSKRKFFNSTRLARICLEKGSFPRLYELDTVSVKKSYSKIMRAAKHVALLDILRRQLIIRGTPFFITPDRTTFTPFFFPLFPSPSDTHSRCCAIIFQSSAR